MQDRLSPHLPMACAGISPRRPLVFWGLIGCNLAIWIGLAAMVAALLAD